VVLPHKRRTREIAQEKLLHLGWLYVGVSQAFLARLDGQRPEIAVGEGSKGRFSDSNDRYFSHVFALICP